MTDYQLGDNAISLPRQRIQLRASGLPQQMEVSLVSVVMPNGAGQPPDLWTKQGPIWVGMFNKDVRDGLPIGATVRVAQPHAAPFPPDARIVMSLQFGLDTLTCIFEGIGGLLVADVLRLTFDAASMTFTRISTSPIHDPGMPTKTRPLSARGQAAAAACRKVLGKPFVPADETANVIVAVDGSGSMKASRTREQLADALDCIDGVQTVLGGAKALKWALVGHGVRWFADQTALVAHLDEQPFAMGISMDRLDLATGFDGELSVVYLVTDDLPPAVASFADVDMQARHVVSVGSGRAQPESVGPIEVTDWPSDDVPDDLLGPVVRGLLRGCFDASSECGQAVAR